jgi:signal peptidase I
MVITKVLVILVMMGINVMAQSDTLVVPHDSMAPSYVKGEKIRILPCGANCSYSRGDVVAFSYPNNRNVTFFKRIIAIPGDVLKVDRERVILNGSELPREYYGQVLTGSGICDVYSEAIQLIYYSVCQVNSELDDRLNTEVKLGENKYFLLGDNRQRSRDSRHFGSIEEADLLGKVVKDSY